MKYKREINRALTVVMFWGLIRFLLETHCNQPSVVVAIAWLILLGINRRILSEK